MQEVKHWISSGAGGVVVSGKNYVVGKSLINEFALQLNCFEARLAEYGSPQPRIKTAGIRRRVTLMQS